MAHTIELLTRPKYYAYAIDIAMIFRPTEFHRSFRTAIADSTRGTTSKDENAMSEAGECIYFLLI